MAIALLTLFLGACTSEKPATAPAPPPAATVSGAPAPAATTVEALALRIVELQARVDRLEAIVRSHGERGGSAMPADHGSAAASSDPMSSMMAPAGMGSARKEMGMGTGNMDKVPMDKPMEHAPMGGSGSGTGSGDPAASRMGHM